MVLANQKIELVNLSPKHCRIALLISQCFLTILHLVSSNGWDHNVDDRFELLELFGTAVLRHKIDLAPQLILVAVVDPEKGIDHYYASHPSQLERGGAILCFTIEEGLLHYDRQADL